MRQVKAYKAQLSFSSTDKYYIFLKRHILRLNPTYYVVIQKQKISTLDGIMYALCITKDIEINNAEPIAECFINSTLIYLWRDYCWALAVDKHGQYISQSTEHNKTLVIHPIGISKVQQEKTDGDE